MADLPIKLWHSIFDHLQLTDLSSCAQVSKTVYLAVKEYQVQEIAFTRRVHRWFHPAPTNHKHRVDFTKASILKRSSFNFIHLKRLKIGRSSAIDLNEINRFVDLEELDIDLANYRNTESLTLSLLSLKLLYVFVPDHLLHLELDTPRLTKVCTFSLERLEFIYPESVRCIHTFCHAGKLSTFRNLECFVFTDHYNELDYSPSQASPSFEEFSLKGLEKLKEIEFFYHYSRYNERNLSLFKEVTANLLALGRPDLKVFWFHVQMTHTDLLTEYERTMENVQSLVAFQLKHYEKLKDKIEFFWSYEFNGSMSKLKDAGLNPRSEEFKSKFLTKFFFRRIKIAGKVIERELLMELIERSPNLLSLEFEYSHLGQEFFDQMAETVRLNAIPLQLLRLKGASNGIRNFDFVTKFRDLELLETDQHLSPEFVSKLFRLPVLAEIECSSRRFINRIERLSRINFRLNGESLSLQMLLEHLNTVDRTYTREAGGSQRKVSKFGFDFETFRWRTKFNQM